MSNTTATQNKSTQSQKKKLRVVSAHISADNPKVRIPVYGSTDTLYKIEASYIDDISHIKITSFSNHIIELPITNPLKPLVFEDLSLPILDNLTIERIGEAPGSAYIQLTIKEDAPQ